jgi:hypothetical protein
MGYVYLWVDQQGGRLAALPFFSLALIPCYLGTVVPDLDITLLGVGAHRNPLFHSSLSFFLMLMLVGRRQVWLQPLSAGFGVGLAKSSVVGCGRLRRCALAAGRGDR